MASMGGRLMTEASEVAASEQQRAAEAWALTQSATLSGRIAAQRRAARLYENARKWSDTARDMASRRARVNEARQWIAFDPIYVAVSAAMQLAEEVGGPEGEAYVALMRAIAAEATRRADTYEGGY